MPDYIYLLENRLSQDQRHALQQLREAAREAGMILFLTGDAVRDLTSGHAVCGLEVSVHGNALKLKKAIENLGGVVWGEHEPSRSLYLCFPGTVRVDLISTHSVSYPKPGKPVYLPASIHDDLRRRDFTVNAMAISLNEGSFGLLMDPLNGAADIEARTLRLVSNYGFIEEPSLMIRATRYRTRLGWELDPRTQTRYENAKGEGLIDTISPFAASKELEQIGHEEDGLGVLRALEAEGWMKTLCPAWTAARADEEKLKHLHELAVELLLQGIHADMSAAQMQLLTAKMPAKDLAALKAGLLRPGFVEEWNSLDALAAGFSKVLLAKENAVPSASYKLFTSYDPEAVLWLGFTSKSAAVQERFNLFLKTWPEARQRIPHAQMQEMRITPELAAYAEIVQLVFLELIDGKLNTPEEIRAFLEPFSPPAPPPQVTIKRTRAKRGESKIKEAVFDDEDSDEADGDDDLDDLGGDDSDEIDLGIKLSKEDIDADLDEDDESGSSDEDDSTEPPDDEPPARRSAKAPKTAKAAPKLAPEPIAKSLPEKPKAEAVVKPQVPVKGKAAPIAKPVAKAAAPEKKPAAQPAPAKTKPVPATKKPAVAVKGTAAKLPSKTAAKPALKPTPKVEIKPVPAAKRMAESKVTPHKGKVTKPVAKKPAQKPAKKR
jgi:tRNA nucleotidyltransferase/poly(A) polymerase